MRLKMSSAKWWSFWPGEDELTDLPLRDVAVILVSEHMLQIKFMGIVLRSVPQSNFDDKSTLV